MTLDRRKKIILCIAIVVIAVAIYYFFFRKKAKTTTRRVAEKQQLPVVENPPSSPENTHSGRTVDEGMNLPDFLQLQYKISMNGKKAVFPIVLEKVTDGPIELPNRRSLISKDVKFKFVDIMPGEKIKVVSLQRLNYIMEKNALSDDFLVTDNDYVIAYSQAKEHFKIVG